MSNIHGNTPQSYTSSLRQPSHVYATIRPENQAAFESMDYMGQNFRNLSDHHLRYLYTMYIGMFFLSQVFPNCFKSIANISPMAK